MFLWVLLPRQPPRCRSFNNHKGVRRVVNRGFACMHPKSSLRAFLQSRRWDPCLPTPSFLILLAQDVGRHVGVLPKGPVEIVRLPSPGLDSCVHSTGWQAALALGAI
uniref:Uncharacterized protein n=1 Tax=Hyaloperonospora arabidopsidis (strain Emoy2) TaxID=559515 RepID=M4BGG2_HYAAE